MTEQKTFDEHKHHEELIRGIKEQYLDLLNDSFQGIYIYLDDNHKVCNKRFSELLGYKSPEEWAKSKGSFLDKWVDENSHDKIVFAFENAMKRLVASKFNLTWIKKDGGLVDTKVILVPIEYKGHILAIHFLSIK